MAAPGPQRAAISADGTGASRPGEPPGPVGFITYSATFGIAGEGDRDVVVVSGVGAPLAQMLRAVGQAAISADESTDAPAPGERPLSSATVLSVPSVQRELARLGVGALVPFKSNARLIRVAQQLGIRILASDARLVRQLENKLQLPQIAQEAQARIPQTRTVRLDEELLAQVDSGDVELPRIFQPAVSFAGAGTQTLRTRGDVARLVGQAASGAVGKLAQPIAGEPITVTGVVLGDGGIDDVLVAPATRQLTGVPGLTAVEFGSCGNEWSLPLPAAQHEAVRAVVGAVGSTIARRGFRGLFGTDLVIDPQGDPVLIEVNPRITASLGFALQVLGAAAPDDAPSLLDAHLVSFGYAPRGDGRGAGGPGDGRAATERVVERLRDLYAVAATPPTPPPAANAIVYQQEEDPRRPAAVSPGVYTLDPAGGMTYVRPGLRLGDLSHDDEFVVLPQPPTRPVPPAAELGRVLFRRQVALDARCRQLLPQAHEVLAAVAAALTADS